MSFLKRGEIYPTWLQHPTGEQKLIHTAAEDAELGPEWDVPQAFAEGESDDAPADATADAPKKRGRPRLN